VPLALFFRTRQRFGELVDNLSNAFVSPASLCSQLFWPLPHRRNRDVLALARLRRLMLRIVPFRVAHRLYDRVGLFGWIEKLVLWMIVRKNV
jgi:hypothetical protein